jgi:N-acetylglucosamine kinase-like BadF-type ATPase
VAALPMGLTPMGPSEDEPMTARIVAGVDGGGTHTRVMLADVQGCVVSYAEAGGSNPNHQRHAAEHVQAAIRQALEIAGAHPVQIIALVAGFAGLDTSEDQAWAEQFTALPGLVCPRRHVNDAVIAHAGALRSEPGIIAVSGTGSIVLGITPDRRQIRNYDFHHYAPSAARFLSYETVFRIIAGEGEDMDLPLVEAVLSFWGVNDLAELSQLGARGFEEDRRERNLRFGQMAELVTRAAVAGVPVACTVCQEAAQALARGIRLVGACFPPGRVPVALVGSVARSAFLEKALILTLSKSQYQDYQVMEPVLSSVQGAVLMALEHVGRRVDDALVSTLIASTSVPPPGE